MTPFVNGESQRSSDPGAADSPDRPLRADAARNRERIREAAEEVFAREGLAVPVDTVAQRAGVGVGTLYRHFPTKEALFEAIVLHRLEELVAAAGDEIDAEASAVADGAPADSAERFFAFLDRVGEQAALKHDLFDALGAAGVDLQTRCSSRVDELKRRIQVLYERAVADGGIRGDLDAEEVMHLVMGVAHRPDGRPADPDVVRRLLRVVCDGLRVRS
jgi:AcrR family transcriptional regulator